MNDIFIPNYNECYELLEFAIYNRWGIKVFETDHREGWDGTYKGKIQPTGVYYYYSRFRYAKGGFYKREGTFNLIR